MIYREKPLTQEWYCSYTPLTGNSAQIHVNTLWRVAHTVFFSSSYVAHAGGSIRPQSWHVCASTLNASASAPLRPHKRTTKWRQTGQCGQGHTLHTRPPPPKRRRPVQVNSVYIMKLINANLTAQHGLHLIRVSETLHNEEQQKNAHTRT